MIGRDVINQIGVCWQSILIWAFIENKRILLSIFHKNEKKRFVKFDDINEHETVIRNPLKIDDFFLKHQSTLSAEHVLNLRQPGSWCLKKWCL